MTDPRSHHEGTGLQANVRCSAAVFVNGESARCLGRDSHVGAHRSLVAGVDITWPVPAPRESDTPTRTPDNGEDFRQRLASIKRCIPHMADVGGIWPRDVEWLIKELEAARSVSSSSPSPTEPSVQRVSPEEAEKLIGDFVIALHRTMTTAIKHPQRHRFDVEANKARDSLKRALTGSQT